MNLRKPLAALLLPLLLLQFIGCYKWEWVERDELRPKGEELRKIQIDEAPRGSPQPDSLRRATMIEFEVESPARIDQDTLVVSLSSGPYRVALDRLELAEVKRPDNRKNLVLMMGVLLVVLGVAALATGVDNPGSVGWSYNP
jgi:hypothetical protein